MPGYRFRAVDHHGRETRGRCDADDEGAARQYLRERGLVPLRIDAAGPGWRGAFGGGRRWPASERLLFARQFAALLQGGMPVEGALAALFEQSDQPQTRAVIADLRRSVAGGTSLAAAMGELPKAFDPMSGAIVRVAERSGRLAEVLTDLADHLEASDRFRQRLVVAMLYPAAVMTVALLVLIGLLSYVVPQIVEVFARQQQALPLLTRLLITVSEWVRAGFWPGLGALIGLALLLRHQWGRPDGRARLLAMLGRLPVVGGMLRTAGTQRLAAALSMALKGGVPLVPSLSLCNQVVSLPDQRQAVAAVIDAVGRGASFTAALGGGRHAPIRCFEPVLRHFVALGEQNGRLGDMLGSVAAQLRSTLEYRLGWIAGLLEPLLVVTMGGLVLLIVLAVLLPIIEVNQFLR